MTVEGVASVRSISAVSNMYVAPCLIRTKYLVSSMEDG